MLQVKPPNNLLYTVGFGGAGSLPKCMMFGLVRSIPYRAQGFSCTIDAQGQEGKVRRDGSLMARPLPYAMRTGCIFGPFCVGGAGAAWMTVICTEDSY